MDYVNLGNLQAAPERLQKQILTLQLLCEETLKAEDKIKYMDYMDYMDNTRIALLRSREALEENIRVLTSLAAVLQEVSFEYRETEARITDRYNLDIVVYPKTRFEKSRIIGMEEYQSLMPF